MIDSESPLIGALEILTKTAITFQWNMTWTYIMGLL